MNIITDFITTIKSVVLTGAGSNAAKIATAISPVFAAAIGVYIIVVAYNVVYSDKDILMKEVVGNIMKMAIVGAFTFSASYYSQYVMPFVLNAGDDLSSAVSGTTDVAASVDSLWQTLSTTMDEFIVQKTEELGMTDIGGYIGAYIIWGLGYAGGAILIFYTTLFLCISTFMVGLLLSVGILFICFSFFSTTRGMFTSWCGSCLNYILLNVFYTISFGFVTTLIKDNMLGSEITVMSVITLLLVICISVFLIEQIGTLCSSITGGIGINGLTSAANGMGGKMAGGLARASGMRAFMGGMGSKMGNPAFNAGSKIGSKLNQFASRGSKVLGG